MSDVRQFIVTRAQKTGQKGQNTRVNKNDTFAGKTPFAAAKKAFKTLCKGKKVKGQCALNLSMKEIVATPSGSPSVRGGSYTMSPSNKEYKYRLKRKKETKVVMRDGVPVTYKYLTKGVSLSKKGANSTKKLKF